ncbi:hypothetical protein [Mycolicibacterium pulveris]
MDLNLMTAVYPVATDIETSQVAGQKKAAATGGQAVAAEGMVITV